MDGAIARWAATTDDDFAARPFPFHSVTYGRDRVVPGWAAVTHLFNHQAHHRGQVTTLLKQLGQDPGVTDLPWMPFFDRCIRETPVRSPGAAAPRIIGDNAAAVGAGGAVIFSVTPAAGRSRIGRGGPYHA